MKKIVILILMSVLTFSITSCSDDDKDNNSDDTNNSLSGTHWVAPSDSGNFYVFSSITEYVYTTMGSLNSPGTYTFNGSSGVLTVTSTGVERSFTVTGDIMIVQYGSTSISYAKQ